MLLNRKTLFGVVLGIFCTLTVIWIYRTILMEKTTQYSITLTSTDLVGNKINIKNVIQQLESSENVIERISSTNKRVDDVLIFGGIIVTLLLAISVGVYVKAESEVDKHFKENFEHIRARVNEHVSKIEQASSKAQAQLDVMMEMSKSAKKTQTVE